MGSFVPLTLSDFGRHLCIAASVIGVFFATAGDCTAQGKLDARYTASLAGVPIGKGAWIIDIGEDQYTAAASGMTAGIGDGSVRTLSPSISLTIWEAVKTPNGNETILDNWWE